MESPIAHRTAAVGIVSEGSGPASNRQREGVGKDVNDLAGLARSIEQVHGHCAPHLAPPAEHPPHPGAGSRTRRRPPEPCDGQNLTKGHQDGAPTYLQEAPAVADVADRTTVPDAVHGDDLDGIADRPGEQLAPGSRRTLDLNPFDSPQRRRPGARPQLRVTRRRSDRRALTQTAGTSSAKGSHASRRAWWASSYPHPLGPLVMRPTPWFALQQQNQSKRI